MAKNVTMIATMKAYHLERTAAERQWRHSEQYKFCCTTLLSDDDAKTFNHLAHSNIYEPDIQLKKEE
jgi:hypothetical protein